MTQPTQRLLELIASFESFRADAYICPGGTWTVGYGTTRYANGEAVKKGDTCTRDQAWSWLSDEVAKIRESVISAITWQAPEHIVDACTSLAYNIGADAFRDSTCLKRLNNGDRKGAAEALRWWNKANDPRTGKLRVLGGLVARREAEADLLENGWDGTASTTASPIQEKAPLLVKSGGVWAQILTALGGLGGVAVLAAPQIMERGNSIADQVTAAQSMTDVMVAVGTILGGLAIGLYRKRQDFRSGDFGSQGR